MSPIQRTASVHDLVPLIFVEDIDRSVAFYREKLGFDVAEKWEPDSKLAWCRLQRGGSAVVDFPRNSGRSEKRVSSS